MTPLFAHQRIGGSALASRPHGYLGDPPGMGKTRTLLHAVALARVSNPIVFCPAIVRTHWRRESQLILGEEIRVRSYDEAVLGNYGLMRQAIIDEKADALILDEAHYLKHAKSLRTQILLGPNGYARRIPIVWAASGTPVPRHPGEFWTVLSSLFPDVALAHGLKTRAQFEARFCKVKGRLVRGVWREKVVGMQNDAEFREILAATMIRRPAQADVPQVWWQPLTLDGEGIAKLIDEAHPEAADAIRHSMDAGYTLADLASDPHVARYRRKVGEMKVKPLVEMLAHELQASNEKIVIFAHHRTVMNALYAGLKSFGVAHIDGMTAPLARDSKLKWFQTSEDCRVFIGQNQACGTGFDGLQHAASRMVIVEPSWIREDNVQLGARLARMGQRDWPVRAQMVCLAGTLDEWIIKQNVREAEMHDRMFTEKAA